MKGSGLSFIKKRWYGYLGILLLIILTPWQWCRAAAEEPEKDRLQFTACGHLLGFQEDGVLIASRSYVLRIGFVNGSAEPVSATASPDKQDGRVQPLQQVTYTDLWPGINLGYTASDSGITESTWRLAPGSSSGQIQLRYNAPVSLNADGSLKISYPTGWMSESAPKAWQVIDGKKVPVQVSFRMPNSSAPTPGAYIVGFQLGEYDRHYPLLIDPTLEWNAFLGASANDWANDVTVDGNGNIFVTGDSFSSWQGSSAPKRAFTGTSTSYGDAFVAKLNAAGVLQWNTFLGSTLSDSGYGIALDATGSVFVTGVSSYTWKGVTEPIRAFTDSGGYGDTFVAKLNPAGDLQWNTFLGGPGKHDFGSGIALDSSGTVLVTGTSSVSWKGTSEPIRAFSDSSSPVGDAFVAKLNTDGSLLWNTFLGSSSTDSGQDIAIDGAGNILITGTSTASWQGSLAPRRAYTADYDTFVAKLNSDGDLQWNTFLGDSQYDAGLSIAADVGGNVLVVGSSYTSWQKDVSTPPLRAHQSSYGSDAFVAKLNSDGYLQWNTFLGGDGTDGGRGIALDGAANILVSGRSNAGWQGGSAPIRAYQSDYDAFVARLNADGVLQWNAFLGGTGTDYGDGIAVDGTRHVLVVGRSNAGWQGSTAPTRAYESGNDAFVAMILDPTLFGPAVEQECTFFVIPLKNGKSFVPCL